MHGLHKTSTSKGEQKSAIKFHKFPVYQKTEQQGIRSKGSRNETVYIYIYITVANFSSRARPTTKREKLALLGEDGNTKTRGPLPAITGPDTSSPSPSHGCHSSPPTKGKTGGCKDTRGITRSRANQVPQR